MSFPVTLIAFVGGLIITFMQLRNQFRVFAIERPKLFAELRDQYIDRDRASGFVFYDTVTQETEAGYMVRTRELRGYIRAVGVFMALSLLLALGYLFAPAAGSSDTALTWVWFIATMASILVMMFDTFRTSVRLTDLYSGKEPRYMRKSRWDRPMPTHETID